MQLIKKYLHFKAQTIRTNYDITSEVVEIPEDLFNNNYFLDSYIKGVIYNLIKCDNNYKYKNDDIFIKIIYYKLTDFNVIY